MRGATTTATTTITITITITTQQRTTATTNTTTTLSRTAGTPRHEPARIVALQSRATAESLPRCPNVTERLRKHAAQPAKAPVGNITTSRTSLAATARAPHLRSSEYFTKVPEASSVAGITQHRLDVAQVVQHHEHTAAGGHCTPRTPREEYVAGAGESQKHFSPLSTAVRMASTSSLSSSAAHRRDRVVATHTSHTKHGSRTRQVSWRPHLHKLELNGGQRRRRHALEAPRDATTAAVTHGSRRLHRTQP